MPLNEWALLALQIDWTLSASNILAYLAAAIGVAWALIRRLDRFELTLKSHGRTLADHDDRITNHDEKFDKALDRIADLAAELQRVIGRSEIYFERRKTRRDPVA